MISDKTKARWQEIVDGAADQDHRLTDWEREFADSISIQLSRGKELSVRQTKVLYRMSEKYGL